jgi:hypothetical protein
MVARPAPLVAWGGYGRQQSTRRDKEQVEMSRGIGTLQREILEALNEAHEADFLSYDYRTVYDLSAVKATLAARGKGRLCQMYVPELGARYVWRSGAFEASFSRAIRTLIARGVLRKEVSHRHRASGTHTYFVSRHTENPISVNMQLHLERLSAKSQ